MSAVASRMPLRSKGLGMMLAFLLAAGATLAVYLYIRGLESGAAGPSMVSVLVAKTDIRAGTDLDTLIADGSFEAIEVPENAVVPGAITDLGALQGQKTGEAILAGEQIPAARVSGAVPGGRLGIPAGHRALALKLDAEAVAGGEIRQGDHVTMYATFSRGAGEPRTVVLVPDVLVLKVTQDSESQVASKDSIVTLALKPADAQRTVFAQEEGSVWLSLIPPDETGERQAPVGPGLDEATGE